MGELEKEFKKMCELENKLKLWDNYASAKSLLTDSYFPYISDAIPWHTRHDIGHVDRVLEKLHFFLVPHLQLENVAKDKTIDLMSLNLLLNATLWHDIGNLYGRVEHNKNMKHVFGENKDSFYDSALADWIVKVAQAHFGENGINAIGRKTVLIGNSLLFPQFLAALLRISDEMEEDYRRVEERLISSVPKKHQAYWKFCIMNKAIVPTYIARTYGTRTDTSLIIKISAKFDSSEIWDEWGKNSGMVKSIEEYIRRIQKINRERRYCNQFLTQTLYFHAVDGIDLCIDIYDRGQQTDKIRFMFDDYKGDNEFFSDNRVKTILNGRKF